MCDVVWSGVYCFWQKKNLKNEGSEMMCNQRSTAVDRIMTIKTTKVFIGIYKIIKKFDVMIIVKASSSFLCQTKNTANLYNSYKEHYEKNGYIFTILI